MEDGVDVVQVVDITVIVAGQDRIRPEDTKL